MAQDDVSPVAGIGLLSSATALADALRREDWLAGLSGGLLVGLSAVSLRLDMPGTLMGWAFAWVIEHEPRLRQLVDQLGGDAAKIRECELVWRGVATSLRVGQTGLDDAAAQLRRDWPDDLGVRVRGHVEEHSALIAAAAEAADLTADIFQALYLIMTAARSAIVDLIGQLLTMLAKNAPVWIAFGVSTPAAPFMAAAAVARLAQCVREVEQLCRVVGTNLDNVYLYVDGCRKICEGIRTAVPKVAALTIDRRAADAAKSVPDSAWAKFHRADPEVLLPSHIPPPVTSGPVLHTTARIDSYAGEDHGKVDGGSVRHLTAAEREHYRLVVHEGRLYDTAGNRFDTTEAVVTDPSVRGKSVRGEEVHRSMFVMDEHGNLYASERQEVGRFQHSSFMAGGPVAAAGELVVEDGVLVKIEGGSRDYDVNPELTRQAVKQLRAHGITLSDQQIILGNTK